MDTVQMRVIARMKSDFPSKFGIPRQSGLVESLHSTIIFEPEFRNPDALRGLEDFSHLWIIWQFSEAVREDWSPTVRPPRLGGNARLGVFATRSPFRPNAIGLSSVKICGIEHTRDYGTVIHASGADLMDGTPIYDVKPYLPFTDSHPEARGGFADDVKDYALEVVFPEEWLAMIPADKREGLFGILAQDPRPSYQDDPDRVYGFNFLEFDVRFTVRDGVITVCEIEKLK